MIAIETKYIGPTDKKQSRIIATTCNNHRVVVNYKSNLGSREMHRFAAEELVKKYSLPDVRLIGGGTKAGYVFVFENSDI